MTTPFNHPTLRDWFFEHVGLISCDDRTISTLGAGPFAEEDFDMYLAARDITPYFISEDTDLLIVGREGWAEHELMEVLALREGQKLRIYSQDMFLCFAASGRDPFDDPYVLSAFRAGHSALELVSHIGFRWPDTAVHESHAPLQDANLALPAVGLLRFMGYKVGKGGVPQRERQIILQRVFQHALPSVVSVAYMEEWGAPGSAVRLRKLANSRATFCRTAKRRTRPNEAAIADWEADLA